MAKKNLWELTGGIQEHYDSDDMMFLKCHPMFERELRKALNKIEKIAREDVRANHHKTGKLMRSIHAEPIRTLPGGRRVYGTVNAGSRLAPYANIIHNGAKEHPITARPGKLLDFWWKGGRRGRKAVQVWEPLKRIDERWHHKGNPKFRTVSIGKTKSGLDIQQGQVLRNRWDYNAPLGNKRVNVKRVLHPGVTADPFLTRAMAIVAAEYGPGGRVPVVKGSKRR